MLLTRDIFAKIKFWLSAAHIFRLMFVALNGRKIIVLETERERKESFTLSEQISRCEKDESSKQKLGKKRCRDSLHHGT